MDIGGFLGGRFSGITGEVLTINPRRVREGDRKAGGFVDDRREVGEEDGPEAARPNLGEAIRRARAENAERSQAVAEGREAELARLELVEDALRPVVDQAPAGVDLFDLGISMGARPRLFVDMIAFIEMSRDQRAYRFFQDTRNGRVLIAESRNVDRIVAAVTNYVARRLVERERALAADTREIRSESPPSASKTEKQPIGNPSASKRSLRPPPSPPVRRRRLSRIGDAFGFLLMTLGSILLICLAAAAGYAAWVYALREQWTLVRTFLGL